MIKVVAIGDLHANFAIMWRMLRVGGCLDDQLSPTPPVQDGRFRVVLMGDLVHPKTLADYQRITGFDDYDPRNPMHLRQAAKAQLRELYKLKRYTDLAGGHATILMGNHDHAVLTQSYVLGNAHLDHREFHPEHGGLELPDDIRQWLENFPMQLNLFGVNFAHVGPVAWLQSYDDLFYSSREPKDWWINNPDYVTRMGYRYGVYGHIAQPQGILLEDELAMIDAIDTGEFLELLLDHDILEKHIRHLASP